MTIFWHIYWSVVIAGCVALIIYTVNKLCARLDRLAAAWEKDDDDDGDDWKKEKV